MNWLKHWYSINKDAVQFLSIVFTFGSVITLIIIWAGQ